MCFQITQTNIMPDNVQSHYIPLFKSLPCMQFYNRIHCSYSIVRQVTLTKQNVSGISRGPCNVSMNRIDKNIGTLHTDSLSTTTRNCRTHIHIMAAIKQIHRFTRIIIIIIIISVGTDLQQSWPVSYKLYNKTLHKSSWEWLLIKCTE